MCETWLVSCSTRSYFKWSLILKTKSCDIFGLFSYLLISAKMRAYTMFGGEMSSVWHDRDELSIDGGEDVEGIRDMTKNIDKLLGDIEQCGVERSCIVLGGFSQGGHLALHAVYGQGLAVGASFSLSSFLCNKSVVFNRDGTLITSPPLFMSGGNMDQMVPPAWVETTRDRLEKKGVEVCYSSRPNIGHEMDKQQLLHLFQWIQNKILI